MVVAANKKRRYGSYLGEISPAPENIINRDFHAGTPNEQWLTDITEFHIPAEKVYLSPLIDCFDGLVVSWTIGTRPDSDLVNTMLDAAIETVVACESKPIIHSERGAHYRWPGWLSRVHDAKLIRSMSRKGCSPESSDCEGFFGRLKTECYILGNGWTPLSKNSFRSLTLTYADITKSESRHLLALLVPLNTGKVSNWWHKPVQVLCCTPNPPIPKTKFGKFTEKKLLYRKRPP